MKGTWLRWTTCADSTKWVTSRKPAQRSITCTFSSPSSATLSGHKCPLKQENSHRAKNVKTETMCSTENSAELQTTRKSHIYEPVARRPSPEKRPEERPEETHGRGLGYRTCRGCQWVCQPLNVAFPSSSSVRPHSYPGAEDQAPPVPGGPGGMWELECGLLPGRRLVRLVDGTRDRVGGRLAPRLRVGSPVRC